MNLVTVLPWPPSANVYYRHNRGRTHISEAGVEYLTEVAWMCNGCERFGARRVAVRAECHPPDHRRRDLDNLGKALLDALREAHVYDDDSQIDDLHFMRCAVDPKKLGYVRVTVSDQIEQVA